MPEPRSLLAPLALAGLFLAGPLPAQEEGPGQLQEAPLVVHAYHLQHQPASEAVALVRPLLSARGTVELQPRSNTVVVRDSLAALSRILPILRSFDHPARPLRLEVRVVRAGRQTPSGAPGSPLSGALAERLRKLLRFDSYRLLAEAELAIREGQDVTYELGSGYSVLFRLGTVLAERRIKLHGFRVMRQAARPEDRELIHTNLNLWLDQVMTLVLASDEASESALIVVLSCSASGGEGEGIRERPSPAGGEG